MSTRPRLHAHAVQDTPEGNHSLRSCLELDPIPFVTSARVSAGQAIRSVLARPKSEPYGQKRLIPLVTPPDHVL